MPPRVPGTVRAQTSRSPRKTSPPRPARELRVPTAPRGRTSCLRLGRFVSTVTFGRGRAPRLTLTMRRTNCNGRREGPTTRAPRVVSLQPSATEVLALIGGAHLLVGRSHECDFPADVTKDVPVVTSTGITFESSAQVDEQVRAPHAIARTEWPDAYYSAAVCRAGARLNLQHAGARGDGERAGGTTLQD